MSEQVPIYLIEALSAFYEEKNLVKTARRLKTTQPTITRQLIMLQSYFKKPLFKLTGREKQLTDFGQCIAASANEQIKSLRESFKTISRQHEQADQMTIKLAGRREFIDKYINKNSFECNVEVLYLSSTEIITQMERNLIDVGVTHKFPKNINYLSRMLFTDSAVILIPKTFSSKKPSLETWLSTCKEFPIATYSDERLFISDLEKVLKIKIESRVNFLVSNWALIEQRINAQTAWTIMPRMFTQPHRDYYILDLPEFPSNAFSFYLYYRRDLRKLPWFQRFLSSVLVN